MYLHVPSRHSQAWPHGAFSYAACRDDGSIIREGSATLSELAATVLRANLVLLIAAADVTLLELKTPPMSEAKLKMALPNLVEDQLMCDVRECVLILAAKSDSGSRTVAVAQREWLQKLHAHFVALGASQIRAIPAQLCLPWNKDQCSVTLDDQRSEASLTLRNGAQSGMGILQESAQSVETWLTAMTMLAGPLAIHLLLPAGLIRPYQEALQTNPVWLERITMSESSWAATLGPARTVSINLMAALQGSQSSQIQWQVWRWPVMLAALVMLVNIVGLNYDYWNLKREAQALKQNMLQTYRTSFPKETVVVYPLEQMRKNLDLAQRNSGQASPDDFTLLLSEFGAVWNSMNAAELPKLVSVEYKDRALVLQLKAETGQQDMQKNLQAALDSKGLVLKKINAEVWQVRNAR